MAKITLNNLTSNYGSQALHNANNATIEDQLNNKVLYRDNPSGEANQMENALDMNSNRILNLPDGVDLQEPATINQLHNTVAGTLTDFGYLPPDLYMAGLEFTTLDSIKTIDRSGVIYAPLPSELPFTTSGTWTADDENKFFVVQGDYNLRADLASSGGELYIGSFSSVADALAEITSADEGKRVSWLGYYSASDGGSGWGIVKTGAHTGDGGSILSAGASLYIEQNLKGKSINVKKYGAAGDGVTEDHLAIKNAIDYSIANDMPVYAPSGTYIIGDMPTTRDIQIDFTSNGQSLRIFGEGETTIFKEKSGKTAIVGRYTRMFNVYLNAASLDLGSLVFENFVIDKNGRSNGVPPTLYEWEQSHSIAVVDTDGSSSFENITMRNVKITDRTGAGLMVGGTVNVTRNVLVDNCRDGIFQEGVIGKRGFVEINANCENVSIDHSAFDYMQIELLPSETKTAANRLNTFVTNSRIDVIEYTSDTDTGREYTSLYVNNCIVDTKLTVGHVRARVSNSTINLPENIFPLNFIVENSKILVDYDGTNYTSIYCRNLGSYNKIIQFINCSFEIDYVGAISSLRYLFNAPIVTTDFNEVKIVIDGCSFDSRFNRIANAYRNCAYEFKNNNLECTSYAFAVGGDATYSGSLSLENNDYSGVVGAAVFISNNGAGWRLKMREKGDASDLYIDNGSVNQTTITSSQMIETPVIFGSAAPSSGRWQKGTISYNSSPAASGYIGWVCTVSGNSGTWNTFGAISP